MSEANEPKEKIIVFFANERQKFFEPDKVVFTDMLEKTIMTPDELIPPGTGQAVVNWQNVSFVLRTVEKDED